MACKSKEQQIAASVDAWAAAHREELVQDLMALIRIPSVTEHGPVIDHLMALGQKYGFAGERDGDYSANLLWPGTEAGRELGMLGHLDTVPAGKGWRYAPYDPAEKDGYVIGRGSSDNKGPVIMALFVMRCMKELGLTLNSSLRLIAGCREETDMQDVVRYLQTHPLPDYTLNCDGAWALCLGEKGIFTADLVQEFTTGNLLCISGGTADNMVPDEAHAILTHADAAALDFAKRLYPDMIVEKAPEGIALRIKGISAHCCVPHQGKNAIYRLLQLLCDARLLTGDAAIVIDRLRQCFPDDYGSGLRICHEDSASGRTSCVGSMLRCENGRLIQTINVRTAVTQRQEQLLSSLQKRLGKLNIALENAQWSPPRYDAQDQPEIQLLLDVCRTYLDKKAKPYVMGGGTHSRLFPRSIPFGAGSVDPRRKNPFGDPHCADEAVCIDDLIKAIKVYVIALLRLDVHFSQKA